MEKIPITGIIPARYGSTRFPGKALAEIKGKTMIRRVYEQAAKALDKVIIATDDDRIASHAEAFAEVVMTRSDHQSGTDRCAEVIEKLQILNGYVINIQGDEPFIHPEQIEDLKEVLQGTTEIATLIKETDIVEERNNPNVVKVVINNQHEALYFSRHSIPYLRENKNQGNTVYYKHLGIYAYRVDVLARVAALRPGKLEMAESLEQLRWLENGFRIKVVETKYETVGIDTPEDLKRVLKNPLFT